MNQFNMSGQEVVLDLPALAKVLAVSTATLSNKLQDELREINTKLSAAHKAECDGDSQENYRMLSHANTQRVQLIRTAQNLADSIEALFHVELHRSVMLKTEVKHHWSK
jgi:ABC-type hemin transport system ATPase subunit